MKSSFAGWFLGTAASWVLVGLVAIPVVGCPHYTVWQQGMQGKAELARAESNRKIAVAEAEALKDSAKLKAEAEIERARGVAEANKIIGASLNDNEAYLRYLWIDRLTDAGQDVIYVPTEAGMPLLMPNRKQ